MAEPCSTAFQVSNTELPPNVAPEESCWFAIHTRPRYEKKVTAELQGKGIEAYLPLYSDTHQWSDRRRVVELPIFPGYVFLRAASSMNSRVSVLRTNGVIHFVGSRNMGTAIPDYEIEAVRLVVKRNSSFVPHPYGPQVGQQVRIRGGCLDGLTGVLRAVNGDDNLIISVNLIQRSIAMRVKGYEIEAISA